MIILPTVLRKAICSEGQSVYPGRCCGALLGYVEPESRKCIVTLLPLTGSSSSHAPCSQLCPNTDDLLWIEQDAKRRGLSLLAFYHSHPDGCSSPCESDLAHVFPSYSHVIVSVNDGVAEALSCWSLSPDCDRFLAEPIVSSVAVDSF